MIVIVGSNASAVNSLSTSRSKCSALVGDAVIDIGTKVTKGGGEDRRYYTGIILITLKK